jgi:hypothetical protein
MFCDEGVYSTSPLCDHPLWGNNGSRHFRPRLCENVNMTYFQEWFYHSLEQNNCLWIDSESRMHKVIVLVLSFHTVWTQSRRPVEIEADISR